MILTGNEIVRQVRRGNITIDPFNEKQINPNSYDFLLGNSLLVYKEEILDPKINNRHEVVKIGPDGLVLEPGRVYLGHTIEVMGSDSFVPIIKGKSSTARLGLFVHMTADLIDLGSINQWTLQLHAVEPIRVYPEMRIGQVTFWVPLGDITLYSGKYQGTRGPVASRFYLD